MSDRVGKHLDKAFASLDDVPVRELVATSEALERRKDGLRGFASIFRNVADARQGGWDSSLPASTSGKPSPAPTRSSPSRSQVLERPSGGMCATLLPSSQGRLGSV
jgi:hypothetical protein